MGSQTCLPASIALTTTFSPPASCNSLIYGTYTGPILTTSSGQSTGDITSVTGTYLVGQGITSYQATWPYEATWADRLDPSCFPSDFAQVHEGFNCPYYSGATGICPSSWIEASTWTSNGLTGAACCPSGYSVVPSSGYTPSWWRCASSFSTPVTAWDVDKSTSHTISTGVVQAAQIDVRWGQEQSSSGSAGTGSNGSNGSGSGLSAGVIAAIAIVVALVVIGGALLAFWIWRRKSKARVVQPDDVVDPDAHELPAEEKKRVELAADTKQQDVELPVEGGFRAPSVAKLGATITNVVAELSTGPGLIGVHELDGQDVTKRAELPGTSQS